MASVYVIESTDGTLSFTIKAGALNGPGGIARSSDLRLYGLGALLWGEGVDENMLRLAENFAVEQKELGDYNPVSMLNDYDPATDPILPKDEFDLGPAKGITVPLEGQLWFNKTDQQMYVIDDGSLGWKRTSGTAAGLTPPAPANVGDLWYDTSASDSQGCIANPVLKVYDPSHPDASPSPNFDEGWVLVGEDFVRQCGDYMSGELEMSEDSGTTRHKIINLGDPTDMFDATTKDYVDTLDAAQTAALVAHAAIRIGDGAHLTFEEDAFLGRIETAGCIASISGEDVCFLAGLDAALGATDLVTELGRAVVMDPQNFGAIQGDPESNWLAAGETILLGRDPTVGTAEAATASFVDDRINDPANGFLLLNPGTPSSGDVRDVVGGAAAGTLEMFLAGTGWVIIFPAQYVP